MNRIFLLLGLLTFSQQLFAQTFQKISVNTGFSGAQGKLAVADLDNDGDPDGVLSSLSSEGLAVFKNNNNGTFTRVDYPAFAFDWAVSSVDVGDVNRDGFIDILQGGSNYNETTIPSSNLLLNNGTTLTASGNEWITQAARGGKVFLGDFEGDGDLDAVSSGANGIVINRNNSFSMVDPYFAKWGSWYAYWWNLDDDSDLEVIQMYGSPGSGWVAGTHFLERNSRVMSVSTHLSYSAKQILDPEIADFDGDGDFDMLNRTLDTWTNTVRIFKNNEGTFTDSGISFSWGESIEFADINNDGLYDVIVGGTMTATWMVFETAIYINNNDGTFTKLNAGITSSERSHARVADFDFDGDLDLLTMDGAFQNNSTVANAAPSVPTPLASIVSGSSVTLQWQPGSDDKTPVNSLTYNILVRGEDGTIVVPAHALPTGRRQIYKIGNAWNNLSFDLRCLKQGKYYWKVQTLDASYQGSAFSEEQSFSIEKGPPIAPTNLIATPISDRGIDLHWTDVSSNEDEYIIYRTDPNFPDTFFPHDTVMADVTSYRDTLNLQPESTFKYRVVASNCAYPDDFESITGYVTTFPRAFVVSGWLELGDDVSGTLALLGDIDRDEDLDLVISYSRTPYTKIFRFNGTGYEDSGIEFSERADFAQWIDYNDDGYLDLLLAGPDFTKLYKNDHGSAFSPADNLILPPTFTSQAGLSVGDYDNDGDEDLALMSEYQIYLYGNDGQGNFTKNTNIQLQGHLKSSSAWADYDNDGDLDLLGNKEVSCTSNTIVIFENTSNNTFVTHELNLLAGTNDDFWNNTGDLKWGDYDNDGYPDIIVAGQNTCGNGSAINRIYHNNGDKTFSYVSDLVQLTYDVNVDWGDYDNDGDLDVFAYGEPFGAFTARTRIYRNEGTKFRETNIDYLIQSTQYGKSARGDIDNDGDLDYVILGEIDYVSPAIIVYRNTYAESWGLVNHKPSAPQVINNKVAADQSVTLSWSKGDDEETQPEGLTYNLYVFRESDASFPDADSLVRNSYSTASGSRMIVSPGNVNGTSITLKNLEVGSYRWAVQSIDKGFAGSAFSHEGSFVIAPILGIDEDARAIVTVYPNPVDQLLNVITGYPQHSLQLKLINGLGEHLETIMLDESVTSHNVSHLPPGLYVGLLYRDGVRLGSKKIIKK